MSKSGSNSTPHPNKQSLTTMPDDVISITIDPHLSSQDRLNLIRARNLLVIELKDLDFSSTDITDEELIVMFKLINQREAELEIRCQASSINH